MEKCFFCGKVGLTLKLKDRYVDEQLDFFDQRSANEAFL